MQITLNGGPFDGKVVDLEIKDHPHIYCGFQGDGYVRIYDRQPDGRFVYTKTIRASELKEEHG